MYKSNIYNLTWKLINSVRIQTLALRNKCKLQVVQYVMLNVSSIMEWKLLAEQFTMFA